MDLSKAFDCIPHGLWIAKMNAYGLSNNACKFKSSYLNAGYQRVNISNDKSSWTPLLKSMLQVSGLGPFIFNVFINDIFYLFVSLIYIPTSFSTLSVHEVLCHWSTHVI